MDQDYYALLGVGEDVSAEEIKAAFRKAALQNHPDRHSERADAEEGFKRIHAAYSVLGNPERRRRYDLYRELVFLCRRWGGPSAAQRAQALERYFLEREPSRPLRKALGALRSARRAGNSLAAGLSLQAGALESRTWRQVLQQIGFQDLERRPGSIRTKVRQSNKGTVPSALVKRIATRLLAISARPLRNALAQEGNSSPEDADIRWPVWISARDAVAGRLLAVSYLRDSAWTRIRFRLPPGVRDNVWLRIQGMGNRLSGRRRRGDLYLRIRVRPWN